MQTSTRPGRARAERRTVRSWHDIIQELRVTQTGTQLLSGFLLSIAFQQAFQRLDSGQKAFYLGLVVTAAVTTAVTLVPVGLHRALTSPADERRLDTIAARILTTVLALVSALTAGVVFFVFDVVGPRPWAWVVGVVTGVGMLVALLLVPWLLRRRAHRHA